MSDETKNGKTGPEQDEDQGTIVAIPLNELIARRIEGLAYRVRMGQIAAFDLAWNMGDYRKEPHKLHGIMIMQAAEINEEMFDLYEEEDTPEKVQRAISEVLKTPVIEVEDRSVVDTVVENEIRPPDGEEDEDFHIIPDDDSDED
jgi:Ran GTPase-activating protein (RanGAP) involved in mRNA processing and transport